MGKTILKARSQNAQHKSSKSVTPPIKKPMMKKTGATKKKKISLPFYIALQSSKWPTVRKIVTLPDKRKTRISELKKIIGKDYGISKSEQQLFFRGNKLKEEYDLFEYGISETNVSFYTWRCNKPF